MSPSPTEWLLVIDMQRSIADPPSPWAAAVDHGRAVRVITDACAGGTLAAHEQTIAVLAGFAPLVTLATTGELT